MPKKRGVVKLGTARKNIDSAYVEEETLKRVNTTLSSIEVFLARWDAAKTTPDDLFPNVIKIRHFHNALLNWKKDVVKAVKKKKDKTRMNRLRNFVLICREYS